MSARRSVLVTSAGRRVALLRLFRHALDELEIRGDVVAADASRLSSALHLADVGMHVPPCTSDEYVEALLDLCRRFGVILVVPTIDPELPILAAHRDAFAAVGATVAVSHCDTVAIGADKVSTHAWLQAQGIPTVRQTTPTTALGDPSAWPLPLIVKPRRGSASVGVQKVSSPAELELARESSVELVVETVAEGSEHTVDVLVDRTGRAVCAVPRRRIEVRAGEVSKGVTVRCPALEALARRVCEALPGAYGTLSVQVFAEGEGPRRVIEINPRFGGGFPLSWEAGAHFPRWMLEELTGAPSTASANGWRDGLVMLRFDEAVFVDTTVAGIRG